MSKSCARCGKTVYPIEELKCLDKIWHKLCFKCQVCQMTLNMRNYKGFNKEPYCEAHIPKAKATTVAETPEYRRIAENTKIQSNVKYHADFEKAKGKFTQVADDPETLRIKENSKNISNVAYHGELQKKADMERQRNIGDKADEGRPVDPSNGGYQQLTSRANPPSHQAVPQNEPSRMSSNVIYTSDRGPVNSGPDRRVGSIHDLDPVNDYYGSLTDTNQHPPSHSYQYASQQQERYYQQPQHQQQQPQHQQQQHQQPQKYQSGYGDATSSSYNGRPPSAASAASAIRPPAHYQQEYSDSGYTEQQHVPSQARNSGRVFRAMYDYKAQDVDEVSFNEGDFIVNCTPIDEGWLNGIVQRTGQKGMLPANYVSSAI